MKYNQKILVIGSNGMAGSLIHRYLKEQGYEVHGTTRRIDNTKNSYFYDPEVDLYAVSKITESHAFDYVINCIGLLNDDAEKNKGSAVLVNAYLPHFLDKLSITHNFKLIHISTDCVFSGEKGGYTESDFPDAKSIYGRTKALGEIINNRSLTLRTSIIGPDPNASGIGLFNWFMVQKGKIKGFDHVLWTGVTTLQLAKSIEESFNNNATGLYHLVNNTSINKYSLLNLFKEVMDKEIEIENNYEYKSDKSLKNTRQDYVFDIPDYKQMVKDMKQWIDKHEELYKDALGVTVATK